MEYLRPQNKQKISKEEKVALLQEYIAHYEKEIQERGLEALNAKIPRELFAPILDSVGKLLLDNAGHMARDDDNIKIFLRANPLPPHMTEMLPDEFRVFALLLNALKQWVSAESAATDRFLLGGTARQTCREAVSHCIVTGEKIGEGAELHHPVRDGRPPILLSKKGHDQIEQQAHKATNTESILSVDQEETWKKMQYLRSERGRSWAQLREGCLTLLKKNASCRADAKSFANVVTRETGKDPLEIIEILDCIGK